MPTGQSTNKELVAGERYQYITTFYEGQNYRIYGCSDSALGDIQLTIRNSSNNNTIDTTVCNQFVYLGVPYTTSGLVTHTFSNLEGCDSVVSFNLTVNK